MHVSCMKCVPYTDLRTLLHTEYNNVQGLLTSIIVMFGFESLSGF